MRTTSVPPREVELHGLGRLRKREPPRNGQPQLTSRHGLRQLASRFGSGCVRMERTTASDFAAGGSAHHAAEHALAETP